MAHGREHPPGRRRAEPAGLGRVHARRAGFRVATAADGPAALRAAREAPPDLVLLDVMLPELDGFEVCRRLREQTNAPIVMLTARDGEVDRVVGLEVGADDYVTKPFGMRELLARVRAHLRRGAMIQGVPAAVEPAQEERLAIGELELDLAGRRAQLAGRPLPLRRREIDLLAYFARNPGVVLTRRQLLANVWDDELAGDTRTVDVHVRRLRRHLGPGYLHTVRGMGYALRPPR